MTGMDRKAVRFPLYTATTITTTSHRHTYTSRAAKVSGVWHDPSWERKAIRLPPYIGTRTLAVQPRPQGRGTTLHGRERGEVKLLPYTSRAAEVSGVCYDPAHKRERERERR